MTKASNKITGSSSSTFISNNPPMVTPETYKPKSSMGGMSKSCNIMKAAPLTHEQIAARAKSIWQKKGCPSGQDKANWLEAESQLKRELSIE